MPRKKTPSLPSAPTELVRQIYMIRGHKVMFDFDLAVLYGIPTKQLNLAVKRNAERFPEDFMFQLKFQEVKNLRFQFETSSSQAIDNKGEERHGGGRYLPYAFTEHGVAMLSSVLRSERAVRMNILIIRAFVQMRQLLASSKELAARVEKLEGKQQRHGAVIELLVEEIEAIKNPPLPRKRRIGYI